MNKNETLVCETCEQGIDCRIGFSNRKTQPLSFSCPHCGSVLQITLKLGEQPNFTLKGLKQDSTKQYGVFDGRNPFIDLHLDFPIWSTQYVRGQTPYLVAMGKIRSSNKAQRIQDYAHLQARYNHLNYLHERSKDIKRIIRLYYGSNKKLFVKKAEEFLEEKLERTLAQKDINLVLYNVISSTFSPFIDPAATADFVEGITQLIFELVDTNADAFNAFMDEILGTGFLGSLQRSCLDLYPRILEAEIALRPALFMDFVDEDPDSKISGRISVADFDEYKDLYKDLTEVIGKQLVLVSAINNILHRQGHNNFLRKDGGALSSLAKFADKTLSEKLKYLDNCWFKLEHSAINAGARNAIAHVATEYDEATQLIRYFAEKEGLKQEKPQEMYFLEFMRMLLSAFREMHYLHHVIKCLFYYEYIIRQEMSVEKTSKTLQQASGQIAPEIEQTSPAYDEANRNLSQPSAG